MATAPAPHKTALITGASSGIGKALAHHFAQAGYKLRICHPLDCNLKR